MRSVGAYEAKTKLPALLRRVAKGEEILITKHGAPVAVLRPVAPNSPPDVEALVEQIEAFGRRHKLGGASARELIDAGRRY